MLVEANKIPKNNIIWKYSNPKKSQKLAHKYFGKNATIYRSNRKNKKYMIQLIIYLEKFYGNKYLTIPSPLKYLFFCRFLLLNLKQFLIILLFHQYLHLHLV